MLSSNVMFISDMNKPLSNLSFYRNDLFHIWSCFGLLSVCLILFGAQRIMVSNFSLMRAHENLYKTYPYLVIVFPSFNNVMLRSALKTWHSFSLFCSIWSGFSCQKEILKNPGRRVARAPCFPALIHLNDITSVNRKSLTLFRPLPLELVLVIYQKDSKSNEFHSDS